MSLSEHKQIDLCWPESLQQWNNNGMFPLHLACTYLLTTVWELSFLPTQKLQLSGTTILNCHYTILLQDIHLSILELFRCLFQEHNFLGKMQKIPWYCILHWFYVEQDSNPTPTIMASLAAGDPPPSTSCMAHPLSILDSDGALFFELIQPISMTSNIQFGMVLTTP